MLCLEQYNGPGQVWSELGHPILRRCFCRVLRLYTNTSPFSMFLGPLHISLVTGLAQLPGKFCGVFIWEISARLTGMNSRNTTKIVEHKICIVRNFHRFLDPCNFTNKANSHTSKVEIHTRSKLCHYVTLRCESKAILFKWFHPGHWAGLFIWENFLPGYRDLGRKNRDLGNQASPASPASHMNTSIFLQRKERRGEISETEPARLTGLI